MREVGDYDYFSDYKPWMNSQHYKTNFYNKDNTFVKEWANWVLKTYCAGENVVEKKLLLKLLETSISD